MSIFDDLNAMGKKDEIGTTYESILAYLLKQGYNLDELGKIIQEQGTQLIIACAGSGKTTGIILKLLADIKTGNATHKVTHKDMTTEVSDKIWVSTFLKSGAEDLQRTFNKKKGEMGIVTPTDTIKFSTLHAEFKHCINAMNIPTHIMESGVGLKIMREVANDFGLGSKPRYPTNEELSSILGYISAARNKLDPSTFFHEDMEEVGLKPDNLMPVINYYAKKRELYKVMDFEDLQELLYKYACNPETRNLNVTNIVANRYDRIIIDEFQDVSEIQYEIFKVYAQGCSSVTVIGDDDQSIYSWRGSNIDIITKFFARDFNPIINKLSRNYRCPSNILDPIAKSIVQNTNRHDKPLKSSKEGGELNAFSYGSTIEMARSVQEMIMDDVNNGRTVAVLGRTNPSLLPLSVFLDFQNKFNYAIRGTLYDLKRVKFRKYWKLANLFNLSGDFLADNLYLIAKSGRDTQNVAKYQIKNFASVLKTDGITVFQFPITALDKISSNLAQYVTYINSVEGGEIEKLKATFEWVKYRAMEKNDDYTEETVSIIELLEMIIDCGDVSSIRDFLYEIDHRNTRLHARADSRDLTIQLTTVHDFKGKEADSVYIWKDTNKLFPSSRSADADYEEERRIHYIAGTRAKEKSTILTIRGSESPFIEEMGIVPLTYVGEGASGTFKKNTFVKDEEGNLIPSQESIGNVEDFNANLTQKMEEQRVKEKEGSTSLEDALNNQTQNAPMDFSSLFNKGNNNDEEDYN
ncbi:UvrD-helicase domain-containing protein [Bacillus toyonensis]|uniref:UvrD-helicase domain-containing protein n=1 Tax=Bacillus toyonensis TaxID=155322 RepID=UPI0020D284C5|nr:ATP-dependent helicase [Bacillus toyonensis]